MIRQPDPTDLKAFAGRVVALLDDCEIPYAIGGSIAAMAYSEPRLSIDVDLMLRAEPSQIACLVAAVDQWGVYITPLEEIVEKLLPSGKPFNIVDGFSGTKADLYPVVDTGLAGSAMRRRRERVWDVAQGDVAWFLAPEDIILFKLQFYRRGGEVAQKHPVDIAKMLEVAGAELDVDYIERWAGELGLADLWNRLWRSRRG